ncbi:hypothetical protein BJX63DRAFT_438114 [Aspergillus granulosus]|uniref:Uncharacterized protein n=1 Tax=Aspergillus granulosus TaxID=176169 RepID=A0ABR4GUN2_9EURO
MKSSILLLLLPSFGGFVCQAITTNHTHDRFGFSNVNNASDAYRLEGGSDETLRIRDATHTHLKKRAMVEPVCEDEEGMRFFEHLRHALDEAPVAVRQPHSQPKDNILLSTKLTFEAIFGKVWLEKTTSNAIGVARINRQIRAATALLEALQNVDAPPVWEVRCSDEEYLIERREAGGYVYWDDRPAERGGQKLINLDHLQGACQDNEYGLLGYWAAEEQPNVDTPLELITFCKDALEGYDRALSDMQATSYRTQKMHISIAKSHTLGFAFLHEISHSLIVLNNMQYFDIAFNRGPNDGAYGWPAVTALAADGDGLINADSFAFYVTAMYLDKNDWHTGVSRTYEDINRELNEQE